MPKKKLAFVLGGGGARGALQVGALRALFEAGYQPELLVGTSIGAVNATYLALKGVNQSSIPGLETAWRDAAQADLLPSNYLWLTVRSLFYRSEGQTYHRMRDFLIAHGLSPELCFDQIQGVRLIVVSVDLNTGQIVPFGEKPGQSILEGVLASTALPPWIRPLQKDGQMLLDGGVVSNLPVEVAMAQGATEIIALDLADTRRPPENENGFGLFIFRLFQTIEQRQLELELSLAEARRIPVRRICLCEERAVPLWDFQHTEALFAQGYAAACQAIEAWQNERRPAWLPRWLGRRGASAR